MQTPLSIWLSKGERHRDIKCPPRSLSFVLLSKAGQLWTVSSEYGGFSYLPFLALFSHFTQLELTSHTDKLNSEENNKNQPNSLQDARWQWVLPVDHEWSWITHLLQLQQLANLWLKIKGWPIESSTDKSLKIFLTDGSLCSWI